MAGPIDVAYVEILPDLKQFDKDVTKGIKAALKDAAEEAEKSTKKIGESISDSVREGTKEARVWVNKLGQEIRDVDGTITIKTVLDGKETVETLKRDLQGRIRKSNGQFVTTGELAGLGLSEGIADGASKGLSRLSGIVLPELSGIGEALTGPLITYAVTFGTALAGSVGQVTAALGAALPAAIGVASAGIATLVLGFQGLSDAVDAFDDDKKFEEALKNLSPAAGRFATEMRGLVPVFQSIRNAAQEGIFKGLEGQLTRVTLALQGPLRAGLGAVGNSIQGIIKQISHFATTSVSIDAINTIFGTTANIIDRLALSINPFFDGIAKLAIAATPFVEKLASAFGDFLSSIGTKLSSLADSGSLQKFFNEAYDTLVKIGSIGKDVFQIIFQILTAAGPSGQSTLDVIKQLTSDLAKFLSQKESVEAIAVAFKAFTEVLLINFRLIKVAADTGKAIGQALQDFDAWVKKTQKSVEDWGKSTEEWFGKAWEDIGKFFSDVGKFFQELPGKIGDFLSATPGFIANAFKNALADALQAIGIGVGLILSFFSELPVAVGNALVSLGTTVATFFTTLWTNVQTWTVTKWTDITAFISGLPAMIQMALSTLPGILSDFFTTLWGNVKIWAVENWNSIIQWISEVPARIAALATNFYNSGINLIKGFFRGITSGAENAAGSVGDAVYRAFKSGLNWAISQINEGISSVDDALPGSLPRIPQLASGGIATGPMLAGIGEAGPEMVMPLSGQQGRKSMQMLADAANGRGDIVFEQGAIAITFDGSVPTRDQAFQVGEAVGSAIASLLQKRQAQTLMRMA